jgi:hypothetical protein
MRARGKRARTLSDTKMIRGGPIFSVSNSGVDDHEVMAADDA